MEIKLEVPETPKPSSNTDPNTDQRFYSHKQRDEAILAFEAEFDQYVPTTLEWAKNNHYFIYGNSMYYYKPTLQEEINKELLDHEETLDASLMEELSNLGMDPIFNGLLSFEDIKEMIKSSPKGLPKFISESPHFLEFESVGMNEITQDMMTKELLDKIKNTFVGEYTYIPFLNNNMFYLKDGEVFFTDILGWTKDEDFIKNKLVFTLSKDNKTYCYPFENLNDYTDKQKNIISCFGKINGCLNPTIVNL